MVALNRAPAVHVEWGAWASPMPPPLGFGCPTLRFRLWRCATRSLPFFLLLKLIIRSYRGVTQHEGDDIRVRCPNACGSPDCNPSTTVWNNARNKPSADWLATKESLGSFEDRYTFYDREALFKVDGFIGDPADPSVRCELGTDGSSFGDCPCVFPFFYTVGGVTSKYTECIAGSGQKPIESSEVWCPTAVTNTGEHLDSSDDWRLCSANDQNIASRRVRRDVAAPSLQEALSKSRVRRNLTSTTLFLDADCAVRPFPSFPSFPFFPPFVCLLVLFLARGVVQQVAQVNYEPASEKPGLLCMLVFLARVLAAHVNQPCGTRAVQC